VPYKGGQYWTPIRGQLCAPIDSLTVAQRAAQLANSLSLSALHICVDPAKLIAAAEETILASGL
jgi:hypothetical protein